MPSQINAGGEVRVRGADLADLFRQLIIEVGLLLRRRPVLDFRPAILDRADQFIAGRSLGGRTEEQNEGEQEGFQG